MFILYTLGVGIAGSTSAAAQEALDAASRWGHGTEAWVWGRDVRLPAPTATLMNAFQVHCQEYDCVCEPAGLHPLATLLPAVFAYAERRGGIDGRALLTAVAVAT